MIQKNTQTVAETRPQECVPAKYTEANLLASFVTIIHLKIIVLALFIIWKNHQELATSNHKQKKGQAREK